MQLFSLKLRKMRDDCILEVSKYNRPLKENIVEAILRILHLTSDMTFANREKIPQKFLFVLKPFFARTNLVKNSIFFFTFECLNVLKYKSHLRIQNHQVSRIHLDLTIQKFQNFGSLRTVILNRRNLKAFLPGLEKFLNP